MISVTRKAEEEIQALMRGIKAGADAHSRCCLHIRGAALGERLVTQLPPLLDKWIGDPQGHIYVCEDRDVFVFSSIITPKFHIRLESMLAEQTGGIRGPDDSISALYDSHLHAAAIEAMIVTKIEKIQARLAEQEEKRRQATLNAQINSELIISLPRRRDTRSHLQVLVIEDDPFSRRMIGLALSPEVEPAYSASGLQGLWDYLTLAPDIVFLDINLPDISGHEVLEKLLKYDPAAHVVMLSSAGSAENVMHAAHNGAKGFVGKPFARHKLHQCLAKCPKNIAQKKEA